MTVGGKLQVLKVRNLINFERYFDLAYEFVIPRLWLSFFRGSQVLFHGKIITDLNEFLKITIIVRLYI